MASNTNQITWLSLCIFWIIASPPSTSSSPPLIISLLILLCFGTVVLLSLEILDFVQLRSKLFLCRAVNPNNLYLLWLQQDWSMSIWCTLWVAFSMYMITVDVLGWRCKQCIEGTSCKSEQTWTKIRNSWGNMYLFVKPSHYCKPFIMLS